MTDLPPARDPRAETYSVALVCLGNICRSPMAQVVLERKLAAAGVRSAVSVTSSGTGDWHLGEPMDRRAASSLARHGYDPSRHRAQHFIGDWFGAHDAVLVMDGANLRDVLRLAPVEADRDRVLMFRAFDPLASDDLDVPDPWYGDQRGFDAVLRLVERTCDELVIGLAAR